MIRVTQRTRFSDHRPGQPLGTGLPADELWGVSNGPRPRLSPGEPRRSPEARARRAAKRAAARADMPLKAYLRKAARR